MSNDLPNSPGGSDRDVSGDVRADAFRFLSRREYSVSELAQKLRARWSDDECVQTVVENLVDEDLLSDARYAAGFVRSKIARCQGPRKIRAQLFAKGVADSEIDRALREARVEWTELAASWLERLAGGIPEREERSAYYRRLINRGFTHDQAMDAVNGRL